MIDWKDFEKVDMRDGTMVKSDEFPETRKPAYILTIDPDREIGIRALQKSKIYTIKKTKKEQVV